MFNNICKPLFMIYLDTFTSFLFPDLIYHINIHFLLVKTQQEIALINALKICSQRGSKYWKFFLTFNNLTFLPVEKILKSLLQHSPITFSYSSLKNLLKNLPSTPYFLLPKPQFCELRSVFIKAFNISSRRQQSEFKPWHKIFVIFLSSDSPIICCFGVNSSV